MTPTDRRGGYRPSLPPKIPTPPSMRVAMSKKVEAIISYILDRAVECEVGKPVYYFDVESGVSREELKRHGKRLRALAREIADGKWRKKK